MNTKDTRDSERAFAVERQAYEAELARHLEKWKQEIEQLSGLATQQNVPESVGDEQTQVHKLQGQWEMAMVQFNQLRAVDTIAAWEDLRTGLNQKTDQLQAALSRTHQQIARNRATETQTGAA